MISFNAITSRDVRNFYSLLEHYDKSSRTIAVLGNVKDFDKFVKKYIKSHPGIDCFYKEEKSLITLKDGIEKTFIRIKNYSDLKGVYFRKVIILKERYSLE